MIKEVYEMCAWRQPPCNQLRTYFVFFLRSHSCWCPEPCSENFLVDHASSRFQPLGPALQHLCHCSALSFAAVQGSCGKNEVESAPSGRCAGAPGLGSSARTHRTSYLSLQMWLSDGSSPYLKIYKHKGQIKKQVR